ncbi:MAG: hypothetical protein NC405_01040 [Odoribacter sp.]|nr:hypothetical protein [Odoribacter sp.]
MKRHLAAAAALIIGAMSMPAQTQLLKDAERALKDGKSPADVVAIITPAFTNPETSQQAQTFFIPGKAMFEEFDKLYGMKQFNKLPENGAVTMADDLLGGYRYFMQALPLDSVPDKKGKIKTKYSKEIINTITGHAADYNDAAIAYWEVQNYNGAYDAWEVFLGMYDNPVFRSKLPNVLPDSTLAEVVFNQGLAAWQADSLAKALNCFNKARAKGYNKKPVYDYAIAVANGLGDQDAMYTIAQEALPLYGKEDPSYIGFIINHYLQNKEFDKAFSMIDEAIANDPGNSQYHLVKGILYDNQDKKAEAKAEFKKAMELDSQNSQALFQYGRALCEEAYTASDNAPTNMAEGEAFYNNTIVPLFKEAAEYLEQAWSIDNDNVDALRYLENVYYNLHDENMMKDVENRKNR